MQQNSCYFSHSLPAPRSPALNPGGGECSFLPVSQSFWKPDRCPRWPALFPVLSPATRAGVSYTAATPKTSGPLSPFPGSLLSVGWPICQLRQLSGSSARACVQTCDKDVWSWPRPKHLSSVLRLRDLDGRVIDLISFGPSRYDTTSLLVW